MVREARGEAHHAGVHGRLDGEGRELLVAMYDLDLLPDEQMAQQGQTAEHRGKRGAVVERHVGDVVHLQTVGEVPHTCVGEPTGSPYCIPFVSP